MWLGTRVCNTHIKKYDMWRGSTHVSLAIGVALAIDVWFDCEVLDPLVFALIPVES